jgi:hypothetical protein
LKIYLALVEVFIFAKIRSVGASSFVRPKLERRFVDSRVAKLGEFSPHWAIVFSGQFCLILRQWPKFLVYTFFPRKKFCIHFLQTMVLTTYFSRILLVTLLDRLVEKNLALPIFISFN